MLYIDNFSVPPPYADEPNKEVKCFLWLPRTEVMRSSQLAPLIPIAAICTVDPQAALARLKALMGPERISTVDHPPRRLRNEEKTLLFHAIGDALQDCLVQAVLIPDLYLGLNRSGSEEIAYQSMLNLLFLPLLGAHKRLGFQRFSAYFLNIGKKDSTLLALAKKTARSCYTRDCVSISLAGDDSCADTMGKIARLVAWAVGHYHNSGDRRWLDELGIKDLPEKDLPEFDVFISHASEDKADFVEQLAYHLRERHLRVWYDSYTLKLGDSLRTAIDNGLSRSRFGVVVLSKNFCRKDWTRRELEGLLALERNGRKVILPIWHNVTYEDVARFSPMLADRVALTTNSPLDQIVAGILSVVRDRQTE